jgi:hypothetical protein
MGSVATCRVLAGDHTESVCEFTCPSVYIDTRIDLPSVFRPRVTPAKAQRIHTSNVRLHAEG